MVKWIDSTGKLEKRLIYVSRFFLKCWELIAIIYLLTIKMSVDSIHSVLKNVKLLLVLSMIWAIGDQRGLR